MGHVKNMIEPRQHELSSNSRSKTEFRISASFALLDTMLQGLVSASLYFAISFAMPSAAKELTFRKYRWVFKKNSLAERLKTGNRCVDSEMMARISLDIFW